MTPPKLSASVQHPAALLSTRLSEWALLAMKNVQVKVVHPFLHSTILSPHINSVDVIMSARDSPILFNLWRRTSIIPAPVESFSFTKAKKFPYISTFTSCFPQLVEICLTITVICYMCLISGVHSKMTE